MQKRNMFFKSNKAVVPAPIKRYRTEQIAHYFLRLSLNELMRGRNGRMPVIDRPFITSDIINHWLYVARFISEDVESYVEGDDVQSIHFDEDVVRRFKAGIGYDELEVKQKYLFHVAFPSIDEKWKKVDGSLIDFLLDAYRAEGYERTLDWAGFEKEHLPIDLLERKEKELLEGVWKMLQKESVYSVTTIILQSQPYEISKIRGEKVVLASN